MTCKNQKIQINLTIDGKRVAKILTNFIGKQVKEKTNI